ncbi:MAG: phosphatase PAP2 family protein [Novosphingobium sp.]
MFDQLRFGYYLLFAVVIVQFVLVFPVGNADIATYFRTTGLADTLVPAWSLFPMVWAFIVGVVMVRRRVDHPLRAMRMMLYGNRWWFARCTILGILIIISNRTFASYKTLIPKIVPFWADPHLAALDRTILGTDAWRITHAVIGPLGTVALDRAYSLWFMVMTVLLGWFCFSRDPKLQLRGLLTYFLCWSLLGIVLATAFASVGPCYVEQFYRDPHFAPLMANLQATNEQHELFATFAREWLLKTFGKDQFGSGISAMPSLHVTIAMLCFLACYDYGQRRWLTVASALFAATIFVGSVHLGWHYASDGLVGMTAVVLIWWATGRFVEWLDARDQARREVPPPRFLPATA